MVHSSANCRFKELYFLILEIFLTNKSFIVLYLSHLRSFSDIFMFLYKNSKCYNPILSLFFLRFWSISPNCLAIKHFILSCFFLFSYFLNQGCIFAILLNSFLSFLATFSRNFGCCLCNQSANRKHLSIRCNLWMYSSIRLLFAGISIWWISCFQERDLDGTLLNIKAMERRTILAAIKESRNRILP